MRDIALFVEDEAHRIFLSALMNRTASEHKIETNLIWGNALRGHGAVVREFKIYLRDLRQDRANLADLVIVATDANCKGHNERLRELRDSIREVSIPIIYAVPDPHIERWLLLDSAAFKSVFGSGCPPPDFKCERARYKKMLMEAIMATGVVPSLGGIEFAKDLVTAMDLERIARIDNSFAKLYNELNTVFQQWSR